MTLEKQKSFEDNPIWKLKVRLQFSGWLQYIVHALLILVVLLIAGIGWLIGFCPAFLFWLPLGVAIILSVGLIGTIIMVKYGMHPSERIPSDKSDLDAFDLMRARYSCRSFQSRDLTGKHRAELMESVQFHSEQSRQLGQNPVRFEYVAAPLTVWPVVGAHEFLVAIVPLEYSRLAVIDVGRSLQKVVLQATRMGLGTCWIGPGADQQSIIDHLGGKFDAKRDHVICVCAIGYESFYKPLLVRFVQKSQHKRLALSELFFTDPTFKTSLDTRSKPYSDYGRCHEVCQWSPSSFNGQTTRCAAVSERAEGQEKINRYDFFAATTSRYYAPVALGIWCANWEAGCEVLDKHGHFAVLSSEERTLGATPELPRYDVSWVVD